MNTTEKLIIKVISSVDNRGYLKARESTRIEFKENFTFSNLAKYFKTIASFANTKGGIILFGVKDAPRTPTGIDRDKFDNIQQDKITTHLTDYFSPQIIWDIGIVPHEGKYFGYIEIFASDDKPVICKKTSGRHLKNGDIYFRYRGQSKTIEYPELKAIQDEIRRNERSLWMKHIERIGKIGPQNIGFIDLFEGTINAGATNNQLVLDPKLLNELKKQVKFIERGRFDEKEGAPTLKVIGEVVTSNEVLVPDLDPNKDYPYLTRHLAEELSIRPYDAQVLIWKLDLKGNKKFNIEIETGRNCIIHKYSKFTLRLMQNILDEQEEKKKYLLQLSNEYQRSKTQNKGSLVDDKSCPSD